jgi:hypothetical protein
MRSFMGDQVKESEMGSTCSMYGGERSAYSFW